jgi:hypothetical protein
MSVRTGSLNLFGDAQCNICRTSALPITPLRVHLLTNNTDWQVPIDKNAANAAKSAKDNGGGANGGGGPGEGPPKP